MTIATSNVLRLVFTTNGGSSFTITLSNPREDLTSEEVADVMDLLIEKNIFLTPSGEVNSIRDIKIVDTTTKDLYNP
jgi:hypothetical protein